MSTSTHTVSKELGALLGNRQVATRADILAALLRYIVKHELLAEDRMIHPDAFLADLLDCADPIHVKDLFFSLRSHMNRPRSSSG
jgi:chromatin remodeling complex protein RSC6